MKKKFWVIGIAMVGIIAVFFLLVYQREKERTQAKLAELSLHEEEITIDGLKKEYRLFFVADTHISLCDERDSEVLEKANQRKAAFVDANGEPAEQSLAKLIEASNLKESDLFIMGGDILDSAMYQSIETVEGLLQNLDAPYLYYMGNHDFEYGTEYYSEKAYTEYFPRLENISTTAMYQVTEYEDLIIFAVNDDNNQIAAECIDAFEQEAKKGKPMILTLHVPLEPLTDTALWEESIQFWGASQSGGSKVLLGENSCYPNENTQKFRDLVLAEDSPVQLILAGHIHFYHKDHVKNDIVQIVTGAGYQKDALFITLKPEN